MALKDRSAYTSSAHALSADSPRIKSSLRWRDRRLGLRGIGGVVVGAQIHVRCSAGAFIIDFFDAHFIGH